MAAVGAKPQPVAAHMCSSLTWFCLWDSTTGFFLIISYFGSLLTKNLGADRVLIIQYQINQKRNNKPATDFRFLKNHFCNFYYLVVNIPIYIFLQKES